MPRMVRTGIDLGTVSVKLVRGQGGTRLEAVTHFGRADWAPEQAGNDVERAAAALRSLIKQLGLGHKPLGRIAVTSSCPEASFREVLLPRLSETDLRQALPYEAKKHLNLDSGAVPILATQILGAAPPAEEDEHERMRVLLASIPATARDFALAVLESCGLGPEVVDLESLACLNALLGSGVLDKEMSGAVGIVDIGGRSTVLHISERSGHGPISRPVGPGIAGSIPPGERDGLIRALADRTRETLTFYRGRFRLEVERLMLCGGGALSPGFPEAFARCLERPVMVLDPFLGLNLPSSGTPSAPDTGTLYTTACGLCRWWDGLSV